MSSKILAVLGSALASETYQVNQGGPRNEEHMSNGRHASGEQRDILVHNYLSVVGRTE
jgi:hypothetical protein